MIRKSLHEVFSYVTDPKNFKLWQPFVIAAEVTSKGPVGKGSTYRYTFGGMGHLIETAGVITEYNFLQNYHYETTSSPFPIKGGFQFEQIDAFVKVTAFGEADPGGYFSMAQGIIGLMIGRQLYTMMRNLKQVMEGDA